MNILRLVVLSSFFCLAQLSFASEISISADGNELTVTWNASWKPKDQKNICKFEKILSELVGEQKEIAQLIVEDPTDAQFKELLIITSLKQIKFKEFMLYKADEFSSKNALADENGNISCQTLIAFLNSNLKVNTITLIDNSESSDYELLKSHLLSLSQLASLPGRMFQRINLGGRYHGAIKEILQEPSLMVALPWHPI